ncbi:MAG: DUF87 domain-containing protein [Chloroflexi bacterium]|nr:DUF87 domain-containing protein [Chloroflexota bacterium]
MARATETAELGTIVGLGRNSGELELVCTQELGESTPVLGAFVVVEEQGIVPRRLLCRVEDLAYYPVQPGDGHGRFQAEHTPSPPVDERHPPHRMYRLQVIGEFGKAKARETWVVAGYRLQPDLGRITARYPTREEIDVVVKAGITAPDRAVVLGHLAFGSTVHEEYPVPFDTSRLERRRTGIFAQRGFGQKTNLCKAIVSLAAVCCDSGVLVLDTGGSYAFRAIHPSGVESPGFADCETVSKDLVVYTSRRDVLSDPRYGHLHVRPILNLAFLWPHQIARLFNTQDQELDLVAQFCYLPLEDWAEFLRALPSEPAARDQAVSLLADRIGATWAETYRGKLDARQKLALVRNICSILPLHRADGGDALSEILYHLSQGRLVVLDLSLTPARLALALSELVLGEVLRFNEAGAPWGRTIRAIAVFEDAEKVLDPGSWQEARSAFVRWAAEGRKLDLGVIYVSRQPGGLAPELLADTENLFVTHLMNRADIEALSSANRHFGGVIARLIEAETVAGNAYWHSAPHQPFAIPARVRVFGEDYLRDAAAAGRKPARQVGVEHVRSDYPVAPPALPSAAPATTLTTQELKILRLITQGKGTDQIAEDLAVSPLTVRNHVQHILTKLNVHTRLEAVIYSFRYGLV